MALNSINTNVAAMRAQENIGKANQMSSSSIARLSSGNRIVRAADDVASMSAGTSLRTNVTTLRTALINTAQGSSMLQVADGALNQITDILLRQKAIAVQAGAGSLSSSERAFLNQEFQNLSEEIDRLAEQTNFNGVNLLDGSVLSSNTVETDTSTADRAQIRISITGATAAGQTLIINGSTITADTVALLPAVSPTDPRFQLGASAAVASDNLLAYLQQSTDQGVAFYEYTQDADGTTIIATARVAGAAGEMGSITETLANGAVTAIEGGRDNGLIGGSVSISGTIGDTAVNTQNQTSAFQRLVFSSASVFTAGTAEVQIGGISVIDGTDFNIQFLDDGTTVDLEATIDEIVGALNRDRTSTDDRELNMLNIYRDGTDIVAEYRLDGDALQTDFATAVATSAVTNITNVNVIGAFTNGNNTGIAVDGITNEAFLGTISGFEVDYVGLDLVDISIKVGDRTYQTLASVNLNTGADLTAANGTAVLLFSEEGDYFAIDVMSNTANIDVLNQDDANDLAGRLDAAFSSLTLYQERNISNFTPIGGASATVRLDNFDDFVIGNITVTKAQNETSDAVVEFNAGGETFRIDDMGAQIRAGTVLRAVSTSDSNRYITYYHGQANFDLTTDTGVDNFEEYLRTAFQVGADGAGASFQVGVTTTDTIKISLGVATTNELFNGASINVLTQVDAAAASDVIDSAIDAVTSLRATVGALQSRFDFASANIESSLQNQDSARGVLLDTDIAAESTAFATAQVQLQAGISVLAQANLLQQNLLKLIG